MSLDLNKLENKLDEALSNETTESLTDWLKGKRMNNTQSSGDKEFVPNKGASRTESPDSDLIIDRNGRRKSKFNL